MRNPQNTGAVGDDPSVTAWDTLLYDSPPGVLWTTVNTEEAIPGVLTPLGWSFWDGPINRAMLASLGELGVLTKQESRWRHGGDQPTTGPFAQPAGAVFFGRFAANRTLFRAFADRLPGTSGDAWEEQFSGGLGGAGSTQTRRRYPAIAARFPVVALRLPSRLSRLRAGQHAWWQEATRSPVAAGQAGHALADAMARFEHAMRAHLITRIVSQGVYEQILHLVKAGGHAGLELRLTTGYGTVEETQVATDLWDVSRRKMSWDAFLAEHGFHGPDEGEISARSWREDDGPLRALSATYAAMDDNDSPRAAATRQAATREAAEAELLRGLSRPARQRAALMLRLGRRYIPLVEVAKGAFVRSIDAGRAAARIAGAELVRRGVIAELDDVFYLTAPELVGTPPPDAAERVAFRRNRRLEYLGLRLPERWIGQPEPLIADTNGVADSDTLAGVGASAGVAEGRARVIRHAEEAHTLCHGEVLVCEITDPSWAPAFHVAAALIIDIGAVMSHGAILAREMGVPCVINTRVGTQVVHTGDTVRVDGDAGNVTILARNGID